MRSILSALHLALLCWLAACGSPEAQTPIGGTSGEPLSSSASAPPSYRDELISLHRSLVEIESVTGNEQHVGDFLIQYLESRGYRAKRQLIPAVNESGPAKTRFNVLAYPQASGSSGGREGGKQRVLVTSHIDVVPPHISYSIDTGSGEDLTSETVIRGRGSVDAKASVAAQVVAVQELLSSEAIAKDDVMFLWVVGEEVDGVGMRYFSQSLQAADPSHPGFNAVIFGEPTENKLACGHKGHLTCTVTAKGKSGHSGYPWLGKSANEVLMKGLLAVLGADLGSSDGFGNTTVNVGMIAGGVAANVIPESAHANLAVRVAIGPQREGHLVVQQRIKNVLRQIDSESLGLSCANGYGVVECNCDVEGFENVVVNYGTDVPNLVGNHTRYLYGPGSILVAHSDHETIRVKDLEIAVEGYKKLIKHAIAKRASSQ